MASLFLNDNNKMIFHSWGIGDIATFEDSEHKNDGIVDWVFVPRTLEGIAEQYGMVKKEGTVNRTRIFRAVYKPIVLGQKVWCLQIRIQEILGDFRLSARGDAGTGL